MLHKQSRYYLFSVLLIVTVISADIKSPSCSEFRTRIPILLNWAILLESTGTPFIAQKRLVPFMRHGMVNGGWPISTVAFNGDEMMAAKSERTAHTCNEVSF